MPKYFTDLVAISAHGNLLGTPFKFAPAGQCGVEYSELIPHTSACADDIALVRSMYTEHNNHEQALWMMHTGLTVAGRPAIGAWASYALGSETRDLPAYVVLRTTRPCRPTGRATGLPAGSPRAIKGYTCAIRGHPCCTWRPARRFHRK